MLPPLLSFYRRGTATALAALLLGCFPGHGAPISSGEALETAYAWLHLSPEAMHQAHGQLAGTVTAGNDPLGQPEFFAVDLAPQGYVVIAADDSVEPVIAFSNTGAFEAVPSHPLFEMLRGDMPSRISRAAGRAAPAAAAGKWRVLRAISGAPKVLKQTSLADQGSMTPMAASASGVNDVRVSPLVKSEWNQLTSNGQPVYNYYTPPFAAGNAKNYYTGCVATMLGQIMRFHQWPQSGVGTGTYTVAVNNNAQQRSLRGGDGAGGVYSWADMPLTASTGMPVAQQQAISALLADAGVASNMNYGANGSAAYVQASVLTNVFHFANAAWSQATLSSLDGAIQANLDAGLPVGLAISGADGGHAVVADGYGYNASTLYHHLNMGWSGEDDAWYNLPDVNVGSYDFTVVDGALFNIDPLTKGEIVSGRIVDGLGNPVEGAPVAVASGTISLTATTNAQGIYAVKGLASNTTWTLTPANESWAFTPTSLTVTTGHSSANGGVGDKSGLNFASQRETGSVIVQLNTAAMAAGACWRLDSGPWTASGVTVNSIPVGVHTLSYRPATGWVTPAPQPVNIVERQTARVLVAYAPAYSLTAIPDNSANGQVAADPAPGALGSYARNTIVTLTASPAAGYYFGGWIESGTLINTNATYTSVVKGARALVANFVPDSLTGENSQVYVTSNKTSDIIDALADIGDTAGAPFVISVTQPANGKVTINANGTLTFTPGKNFHGTTQFSYTAGDDQGGGITRSVSISNWFAASAGTYSGLSLATEITNETSGYLRATVAATGALSAKVAVAGIAYNLSGSFDASANYQKVIVRKNESSLTIALHVEPCAGITGTVSDGMTSSNITASRVTYSARNKAPQAGSYTVLLSANDSVPGSGCVSVTINSAGGVRAAGRLADGTPVSVGAFLSPDGSVPYYSGLYNTGTAAGSILGTMSFETGATPQCTGTYAWFRPASSGPYFRSGFAETGSVTGGALSIPAKTLQPQAVVPGSIGAVISEGGLNGQIAETGQLAKSGKIVWSSAGAENLALSVGNSGRVSGFFVDPATGKKRLIMGAWLPQQGIGGGFFLGETSPGALTLTGL